MFAFNPGRAPTFVYVQRATSVRASEPSQHIYITVITSNITVHHVIFTVIKRSLRSWGLVSSNFTGKPTHIDTIETFCTITSCSREERYQALSHFSVLLLGTKLHHNDKVQPWTNITLLWYNTHRVGRLCYASSGINTQ